ncbi:MAG: hypothetical protein ACTHLU_14780 [Novosphingobium sp.]
MRKFVIAAALMAAALPAVASAEAAKFSTEASTISDLIGNAEAKAVLDKKMPGIAAAAEQGAGGMTLRQLQGMAPDRINAKTLDEIDVELAKIK